MLSQNRSLYKNHQTRMLVLNRLLKNPKRRLVKKAALRQLPRWFTSRIRFLNAKEIKLHVMLLKD